MPPDDLHNVLDSLKVAVLVVGRDLSVTYLNTAAETLLEVSGGRVLGEPVCNLFREPDDTALALREALRTGSAFTKRELQLTLLPSGQQLTVDYAVTPILEASAPQALVLELQPLDRLLRISRDEGILSSQQNTRALVRGLAHEIKSPLGGLRGAAQLLARELPENSSLRDYTNVIIDEADRLRNLVDRLLGPDRPPDRRPLNLHEVVERVYQLLLAESGGRITFERDYDPSIPDLLGDRGQLIQTVLNVARNAVEALALIESPKIILRTRTLRQFTIGTQRHRLVARLEIIDNGPGIPQPLREAIFLPMVSGRPEGTGLGLSIAQSIMNRHGGLIECASQPGSTVFSLYFPIEPEGSARTTGVRE